MGREEVEAALRCWGAYQRVRRDAGEAGRRRAASCHAGPVEWHTARMGHVAVWAWRVERAMAGLEEDEAMVLRLRFAQGLGVQAMRARMGIGFHPLENLLRRSLEHMAAALAETLH